MDYIYLWFNGILWTIIIWIVVKKYSLRNTGTAYIIFYGVLCVLSLHLFYNPISNKRFENQNPLALLYLSTFLVLWISTLIRLDKHKLILVHPSKSIMNPIYIVIVVFSLLGISEIIENFSSGIFMLATDESYGQQLYHDLRNSEGMSSSRSSMANYLAVLTNIARSLAPFFFLYYLSVKKRNIFIFSGLLLSTLISFMNSIALGSRSAIFTMLLNVFFMIIFMRKYYSHSIMRLIKPLFIIIMSVIGSAFIFMTLSRSSDEGVFFFTERYAAQPVLQFGKYGLDPGGCRYGDRTFPLIKSVFTDDVARSYYDRINKYHLKSDESSFITFVGDFTIDYTPFGGAIVMLLLIWFFSFNLNVKNKLGIQHLSLIYLLILILNGFYLYPLCDYLGNITFLTFIALFVFFSVLKYGTISKHQEYSYPSSNV